MPCPTAIESDPTVAVIGNIYCVIVKLRYCDSTMLMVLAVNIMNFVRQCERHNFWCNCSTAHLLTSNWSVLFNMKSKL